MGLLGREVVSVGPGDGWLEVRLGDLSVEVLLGGKKLLKGACVGVLVAVSRLADASGELCGSLVAPAGV